MSHFAKVLDNKVKQVIVAESEFFDTFIDNTPGQWIQTSYNTYGGVHYTQTDNGARGDASADQSKALRYNFAEVGGNYDPDADAFYEAKPHDSWILNTTNYLWEAPIAKPDGAYYWDEDAYQADNTAGWTLISQS